MRILFSGDHHWTKGPRFEECQRLHDWMVDLSRERQVDLFVGTGDLYDGETTPELRLAVMRWVSAIGSTCRMGADFVRGNHDRRFETEMLRYANPQRVGAWVRPHQEHRYLTADGGCVISYCPWPERAWLLDGAESGLEVENRWRAAFQQVMQGFAAKAAESAYLPHILAGHFMVDGSLTSTGQPLIGATQNVTLEDLALAQADLVVMGHVHKPQDFVCGGKPCLYVGSPYATDWGETEQKSVLLAEFKGKELVNLERIPTPARRLVHLDAAFGPDTGLQVAPYDVAGAEVRLRYATPHEHQEQAASLADFAAAVLRDKGAHSVVLDQVIVREQREARVPELRTAAATSDQLQALWNAQGFDPGDRRAALLAKLERLS